MGLGAAGREKRDFSKGKKPQKTWKKQQNWLQIPGKPRENPTFPPHTKVEPFPAALRAISTFLISLLRTFQGFPCSRSSPESSDSVLWVRGKSRDKFRDKPRDKPRDSRWNSSLPALPTELRPLPEAEPGRDFPSGKNGKENSRWISGGGTEFLPSQSPGGVESFSYRARGRSGRGSRGVLWEIREALRRAWSAERRRRRIPEVRMDAPAIPASGWNSSSMDRARAAGGGRKRGGWVDLWNCWGWKRAQE